MLLKSVSKTRSHRLVTDVSPDAYPTSATCCGRHRMETDDNPSLWRGVQRTFYSFTSAKQDCKYYSCAQATSPQMTNNNNNGNDVFCQILQIDNMYVPNNKQHEIEAECKERCDGSEAGTCELKRTIQLMAVPDGKSNRKDLNLVKSNHHWSRLAQISWNCLFTLTLCIVGMFVINQPVAAERPFHHRDMRDEPILNPSQSRFSVENLEAATVSITFLVKNCVKFLSREMNYYSIYRWG